MTIPCPCCKASNESGPNCRRCKADLALLFSLEAERIELVSAARRLLQQSQFEEAGAKLVRAERLRRGDDVRTLRAGAFLLNRDFAAALDVYHGRPCTTPS
jgi:hypothetical protein